MHVLSYVAMGEIWIAASYQSYSRRPKLSIEQRLQQKKVSLSRPIRSADQEKNIEIFATSALDGSIKAFSTLPASTEYLFAEWVKSNIDFFAILTGFQKQAWHCFVCLYESFLWIERNNEYFSHSLLLW